jgi:hypothetical protein
MLKRAITEVLSRSGYEIARRVPPDRIEQSHPDLGPDFARLYRQCEPYTMTSVERMYALYEAVRYVVAAGVEGDVVECGVWRGGSSMLAASTLLAAGDDTRGVWLYDTFEGMTEPSSRDVEITGRRVDDIWQEVRADRDNELLCESPLDEVRANMARTGFPGARIRYVAGPVEDTIPGQMPERIAVLRLDTDWYDSTHHELVHLYPRLAEGGVLIVDDYGHWLGAREAVDGYLREQGITLLLNRIDYTGRIAVKPASARS